MFSFANVRQVLKSPSREFLIYLHYKPEVALFSEKKAPLEVMNGE